MLSVHSSPALMLVLSPTCPRMRLLFLKLLSSYWSPLSPSTELLKCREFIPRPHSPNPGTALIKGRERVAEESPVSLLQAGIKPEACLILWMLLGDQSEVPFGDSPEFAPLLHLFPYSVLLSHSLNDFSWEDYLNIAFAFQSLY